ncbi:hypothetical protein ABIE67_007896 [Streptomyces sp. V4I8]|uniref:hypothetical protein n=1 Tax=Streptomyces sp. V4I8 TaxID=3156469 RepID=UPI0035173054
MKFKATANVTGNRTGTKRQAVITRPAESESDARAKFERDMRFVNHTIDGDIKVERDS